MKRALRLMDIVRRLKDRRYTAQELASLYAVHRRTIQRDLAELQAFPEYAPLVYSVRREWAAMKAE